MRYVEARGDRIEVRESARDRLVVGALFLFVLPWIVAGAGWLGFALLAGADRDPWALLCVAVGVGLGCLAPALYGLVTMATASRRARARAVTIDLGERTLQRAGGSAEVYRRPDAVRVARSGLTGWSLRLEGDESHVLLRGVPHGSGRALAEAADALAEKLGVDAKVPAAARTAFGLVPHDEDVWAALCYAPLDGVNLLYSMLALLGSGHPRLRFAAKQSLVLLALEAVLGLGLAGCLGVPLAIAAAPVGLKAVAFLCPFTVFTLLRVAIRMTAAIRAYRKTPWMMPWLAPVVRRRAPERPHAK